MGYIEVHGGTVADGRIRALRVHIPNLPPRTVDRDTVIRWMRDGHSLRPVIHGRVCPALQLVEVGEGPQYVVRTDNAPTDEDALPPLPPA